MYNVTVNHIMNQPSERVYSTRKDEIKEVNWVRIE